MNRRIFGWSLPPGVSMSDIAPDTGPCDVCGHTDADCICPECPVCYEHGNPACYEKHGLIRTQAQIDGRKALEEAWAADAEADKAMAEQMEQEQEDIDRWAMAEDELCAVVLCRNCGAETVNPVRDAEGRTYCTDKCRDTMPRKTR